MTGSSDPKHREQEDTEVVDRVKPVVPRRYKVIFHNDDYTTMQFVVDVLVNYFHKTQAEATHIMLTVHKTGKGIAGVYTREIAETKISQVMEHARQSGMPLLLTAEPE